MIEFLLVGVVVNFILLIGLVYISSKEFEDVKDKQMERGIRLMQLEIRFHQLFQKVKKENNDE